MRRSVRFGLAVPFLVLAAVTLAAQTPPTTAKPAWLDAYRDPAARLIGEAVSSTFAWDRLAVLTDTIGNRLSGTPALDRAIQWAVAEMNKDGLENVHTGARDGAQMGARHRERGDCRAGPPSDGDARAWRQRRHRRRRASRPKCLLSTRFEELDAKAESARGRIVLFNVPFTNYGETVRFRSAGPSRAARHGAVAMLVRAVGPAGLRTPHTGALQYASDAKKIPAASSPPRTPTGCSAWRTAAAGSSSG